MGDIHGLKYLQFLRNWICYPFKGICLENDLVILIFTHQGSTDRNRLVQNQLIRAGSWTGPETDQRKIPAPDDHISFWNHWKREELESLGSLLHSLNTCNCQPGFKYTVAPFVINYFRRYNISRIYRRTTRFFSLNLTVKDLK